MSDDLTLPGDIPGLLRRGSPVWIAGPFGSRDDAVVLRVRRMGQFDGEVGAHTSDGPVRLALLALDLTDATGRAHAAWWLQAQGEAWYSYRNSLIDEAGAEDMAAALVELGVLNNTMNAAIEGKDMAPEKVSMLRRVVLHVAGRSDD